MRRYQVDYDPRVAEDIDHIFFWLAESVSLDFASCFKTRLQTYCDGLEYTPFRSPIRDELRPGVRLITFENSVTVAYGVEGDTVRVLRLLYRGHDLRDAF